MKDYPIIIHDLEKFKYKMGAGADSENRVHSFKMGHLENQPSIVMYLECSTGKVRIFTEVGSVAEAMELGMLPNG